jgi:hypothetical protein
MSKRILGAFVLALALLGVTAPAALAGPGCPDKPGVCAPGGNFPW